MLKQAHTLSEMTPVHWIIVVVAFGICFIQGIWMFRDAQKRGHFPWLWGLWGLISCPTPLIFYYFFVIRKDNKKKIKK